VNRLDPSLHWHLQEKPPNTLSPREVFSGIQMVVIIISDNIAATLDDTGSRLLDCVSYKNKSDFQRQFSTTCVIDLRVGTLFIHIKQIMAFNNVLVRCVVIRICYLLIRLYTNI